MFIVISKNIIYEIVHCTCTNYFVIVYKEFVKSVDF